MKKVLVLAFSLLCIHSLPAMDTPESKEKFFSAVADGDATTVKQFFDNGFPGETRNNHEMTPLMVAAWNAQYKMVTLLIDRDAQLSATVPFVKVVTPPGSNYNDPSNEQCTVLDLVKFQARRAYALTILQRHELIKIYEFLISAKKRSILAALLAWKELCRSGDSDFPPEHVCDGGALAEILDRVVWGK